MPWYFYKRNGSQKIERRDDDQPGIIKLTAVGPSLTAGTEAEAKSYGAGYLYCNGAAVLITEFTDLYNAFGATDKFKGSNPVIAGRFYLPDYRDRLPIGSGTGVSMASRGGSHVWQFDIPAHKHPMPHNHTVNAHNHRFEHTHGMRGHSHTIDHSHSQAAALIGTQQGSTGAGDFQRIQSLSDLAGSHGGHAAPDVRGNHQHRIWDAADNPTDTIPAFSRSQHTHLVTVPAINFSTAASSGAAAWDGANSQSDGVSGSSSGSNPFTENASPTTVADPALETGNNTGTMTTTPITQRPAHQTCNFIIKI
jgi:microcystin-dependent protein